MKYLILILTLLACTTALFAQNPRIESFGDRRTETYLYKLGQDSVRFSIRGKADTLQTTQFYRNGHPSVISWKSDSIIIFDELGRKRYQTYGASKGERRVDSSFIFYPNGQIYNYASYGENTSLHKTFKENGELISITEAIKTSTGNSITTKNKEGVPMSSSRTDTVKKSDPITLLQFDTIFHANGRPAQISSSENFIPNRGTRIFDESGKLIHTELINADRLTQFKDNVDCYYGLKNHKNDTVVKPRFDLIEQHEDLFFTAYTGESAILLDYKGAPMSPPVDRLSKVGRLRNHHDAGFAEKQTRRQVINSFSYEKINDPQFFMFQTGKNYGVMDEKGKIIMPPQYLPFQFRYVGNGDYFDFQESIKDSAIRNGFLNRQGKTIFDKPILDTRYTNFEDYFFIGKQLNFDNNQTRHINWVQRELFEGRDFDISERNCAGLGKGDGTILLPMKFSGIERVSKTSLFVTTIIKSNPRTKKIDFQEGIFDVHRQKWLVDTLNFSVDNKIEEGCVFFVIRNIQTQKYGIMDTTGKYIVPLSYDSIGVANQELGLFWVKKGDNSQILTIKNGKTTLSKTKYGFLVPTHFNLITNVGYERLTYFIAQLRGKWGVIDAKDQVIKAFDYDYAAQAVENRQFFLLVKNNQAEYFDLESLPNETDRWTRLFHKSNKKTLVSYPVLGNSKDIFFVNEAGKVVIPPQYKPLDNYFSNTILLVENAKEQKKIIYLETSKVVDYPFDYEPRLADANSQVIGVYDTATQSYGVVSTDGKVLAPCVNYGIAIGEANNSAFFVKRDTFYVPEGYIQNQGIIFTQRRFDTLSLEDNDWLLYDSNGKIATTTPFRYPIDFKKGIGSGMQTTGFQLFNSDGTVLTPFEKNKENGQKTGKNTEGSNSGFTNIWREPKLGYYALFKNQGLTPTLILTKDNGEIIVPSGQFDGISKFYDKYAVVTAAGKVGLIDSFGQTIIALQDLRTYEGQFMDSLDIYNVKLQQNQSDELLETYPEPIPQPISFNYDNNWHPDSLKISPSQRRSLWNLMLEKCLSNILITASEVSILHAPLKSTGLTFYTDGHFNGDLQVTPRRIVVSERTTAFCFRDPEDYEDDKGIFYNFYRRDNRWEELKINDLLQIQGEKRWLMNDLITKKVKALKDQQIDCSNAAAFIGQVENRFMLTKDGIDFCFKSMGNSFGTFVIIQFTWAELTPFLKMKIY